MAYDSLEDDGPFADGQIHLTKGKYPRKEGEIVVNQFLAEVNQWEIGETVVSNLIQVNNHRQAYQESIFRV